MLVSTRYKRWGGGVGEVHKKEDKKPVPKEKIEIKEKKRWQRNFAKKRR
jgi:hypothetical protein